MQIDKNYLKYNIPEGRIMHIILILIQFDTFNVFKYFCCGLRNFNEGKQRSPKFYRGESSKSGCNYGFASRSFNVGWPYSSMDRTEVS
jgi:hypothetical protein